MMIPAMTAARSGLGTYTLELAAVADNMANVNTIRPTDGPAYQERFVQVRAGEELGSGVVVTGASFGPAEGRLVHNPSHPYADDNGYVRAPDMDLPNQMERLITAQRGLQLNAASWAAARDAAQTIMRMGGN